MDGAIRTSGLFTVLLNLPVTIAAVFTPEGGQPINDRWELRGGSAGLRPRQTFDSRA